MSFYRTTEAVVSLLIVLSTREIQRQYVLVAKVTLGMGRYVLEISLR